MSPPELHEDSVFFFLFYQMEFIRFFFFFFFLEFYITKAICFNPSGIKTAQGRLLLLSDEVCISEACECECTLGI